MSIDISIVIPTYSRITPLKQCLDSLLCQSYPKDRFEIIVIDDNSSNNIKDEIHRLVNNFKKEFLSIIYISQLHKGPAVARNSGIKASKGEIIGFIDDDCILDKNWINSTLLAHKRNPQAMAVGGVTTSSSLRLPAVVSQFLSTLSIETDIEGKKEIIFFPTCNVSFKNDMLNGHKFDEKFPLPGGEDLEFFWHLFKSGYRFIWDKSIKVIHCRDDTLVSFIKQAYIYGRGNLLVQYIHRDHPLLKELRTGPASFWLTTLINIIKILRFSYLLEKRFVEENNIKSTYKIFSVYLYFMLHKVFYIIGNIVEFLRIKRGTAIEEQRNLIPRLLILDITHNCNLTCRMCDIWKTKEQDIDKNYVKKALFEARKLGMKEIALSGGEPLLRKDIFEILEYAGKIRIKNLGILTNGILVSKYIDRLKPYLLNNTISLVLSFDSLAPKIHNYIRNCDFAWEKTKESLDALFWLKESHSKVNFNVITIILNQNLEELHRIADFVRLKGANSLQFQPLLSNNLKMAERKKSPFWVSPNRLSILDEAIDKLINLKRENPEFIKNSEKNLSLIKKYYEGTISYKDVECNSGEKTCLLSNEGKFTTCFSSYGDIKKQSLTDVLCSKERIQASEQVKKCKWPCLLPCFCD